MNDNLNINSSKMTVNNAKEYRLYLRTDHWKNLKIRILRKLKARDEKLCYVCGYTKKLQLHHRTYRRIGCELDSDLILVCKRCHYKIHKLVMERKSNLYNAHVHLRKKLNKVGLNIQNPEIQKPTEKIITVIPEKKYELVDFYYVKPVVENINSNKVKIEIKAPIPSIYDSLPQNVKDRCSRLCFYKTILTTTERLGVDIVDAVDIFLAMCLDR